MKNILTVLLLVVAHNLAYGQCSAVGIQISSSDTSSIQLYNAGFFLIPSGFANVCEWKVTTFSGEIIHQETTSGASTEQSTVLFNHNVSIADSMQASLVITNEMAGITCTINDVLYWQETEILPGVFIGNWAVSNNNVGVEVVTAIAEVETSKNIALFPAPAQDYVMIKGDLETYTFAIFDVNGQVLANYNNHRAQEKVAITDYPAGVYFVQFWDKEGNNIATKKMVKR